jgi:hypothetical protein
MRDCAVDRYSAYQILRLVEARTKCLRLFQRGSRRDNLRNLRWMLANLTRNYAREQSPMLAL